MQKIISQLKEQNQDFEFYPTTKTMIQTIYDHIATSDIYHYAVLDIGAGNGNFFNKMEDCFYEDKKEDRNFFHQKYAIEKSKILIDNMESDIIVVGTDFFQQTLIDKKVDIIFSNPPYSVYEEWTAKIIKEGNFTECVFLIIPERWQKSQLINEILELRNLKADIIGNFDFLDGERAARAKVDIVKISHKPFRMNEKSDPFKVWFNDNFKIKASSEKRYFCDDISEKKNEVKNQLVNSQNIIETLTSLYDKDMEKLYNNYRSLANLDSDLLEELGVSIPNTQDALEQKIKNYKHIYWQELFNKLDKITSRLTNFSRSMLLSTLRKQVSIDFNADNIYAVVIWTIKNANKYFDSQLKEVYLKLTEINYVKKYKSNQRTWEKDNWKYKAGEENTHYSLEYRIVTRSSDPDDFISDVKTIANNLGFSNIGDVKTFQNKNIHFRFEKEFIKALNIEAGRLFGWLKSPEEASKEMDISHNDANKYFKKNIAIAKNTLLLLDF